MSDMSLWYAQLIKPSWAPPAWVFGPVWTILYAIIFITFLTVFYRAIFRHIPRGVAIPFILNLITNLAFTSIQFGLKNNVAAAIDIVLVLGTLIWALVRVWPHAKWIVYANIPYVAWVLFATILQLTITVLNW